MNEEQAVLDFFSKPENLPLALSVAEQTDQLREQINTRFWRELMPRLLSFFQQHQLPWQIIATEDRNTPDSLVGCNCALDSDQTVYLRPMLEQQNLGKGVQIYFGLMWSKLPTPEQLALPAVQSLRERFSSAGYKNNENFMAWQWTTLHPRSRAFLLRYTQQAEQVFNEIETPIQQLCLTYRDAIHAANEALRAAPRSMTISLEQLRSKRTP